MMYNFILEHANKLRDELTTLSNDEKRIKVKLYQAKRYLEHLNLVLEDNGLEQVDIEQLEADANA